MQSIKAIVLFTHSFIDVKFRSYAKFHARYTLEYATDAIWSQARDMIIMPSLLFILAIQLQMVQV